MDYRSSFGLELIRKVVHIGVGVLIVLLFQARILNIAEFGLLILLYAALMLYNLRAEKELITKVIAINRADRDIPGLDILSYFVGCWIVLAVFHTPQTRPIAFAAIMILAIADPVAHLMSRRLGATESYVTKTSYIQGTVAGIITGTFAAWIFLPSITGFIASFLAATLAMLVEAGELKIGEHHIDDNLTIPLVAAATLWVISLAFPLV